HEEVLSEEGKGGGVFTMAASPSAAHRPWSPSVRGRRTHPARRGSCGRGKMGRGPHGRRRRGPCTLAAVRRDKGPWPLPTRRGDVDSEAGQGGGRRDLGVPVLADLRPERGGARSGHRAAAVGPRDG